LKEGTGKPPKPWKRITLALIAFLLLTAAGAGLVFYLNPLWVNDLNVRLHLRREHVLSRYVDLDGFTGLQDAKTGLPYKIHYFEAYPPRIHGKLLAPDYPIVLIHGLGARAEDWSALIPSLAAHGFHVYALDLLGYGRSSRPDVDYSIDLQVRTVTAFMQAVHLPRADVAGWSMGGWVALKLAAEDPARVNRLVLYDSAGLYFPPSFDPALFTPSNSAGLEQLMAMLSPHPARLPRFVQRAALRKLQANAWIIQRSLASMTSGHDLLDFRLHRITAPTLIAWGKQDTLIPVTSAQVMHRDIPGSSLLLIDGCGHLAPAECTRPILRGTLRFLLADPPQQPYERTVPGH
jgi:pimeloyl-ACP methyl ester carboxylesterase